MNTFEIEYPNGTTEIVKRCRASQLEDLALLQQHLFERFLKFYDYSNNCLGDVISDKSCWELITKIAAMLSVVTGKLDSGSQPEGIKLELLEESYEMIGRIFITQSISDDGEIGAEKNGEEKTLRPSKIAELHGQHFFRVTALDNYRAEITQRIQAQKTQIQKTQAQGTQPETAETEKEKSLPVETP